MVQNLYNIFRNTIVPLGWQRLKFNTVRSLHSVRFRDTERNTIVPLGWQRLKFNTVRSLHSVRFRDTEIGASKFTKRLQ